ncbi:MAG: hypothetical protein ACJ76H_10260 [Bacteriovoracaceae bacterium]
MKKFFLRGNPSVLEYILLVVVICTVAYKFKDHAPRSYDSIRGDFIIPNQNAPHHSQFPYTE